jgi:hypothetical protein
MARAIVLRGLNTEPTIQHIARHLAIHWLGCNFFGRAFASFLVLYAKYGLFDIVLMQSLQFHYNCCPFNKRGISLL